jgi:lipoate---protein ligase
MMLLRKDYKVPGGKLLRVELELSDGIAQRVLIKGDFFAHPEEAFESAEAELSGSPAAGLPERASELFARPGLELYGLSPEDAAAAIAAAVGEARKDSGGGGRA